jgi:hypothetical protein
MAVQNAPHNSAYWHSKAEEARTKADGMRDAVAVQTMLQVARIYEAMAARAAEWEQRENLSSPSGW